MRAYDCEYFAPGRRTASAVCARRQYDDMRAIPYHRARRILPSSRLFMLKSIINQHTFLGYCYYYYKLYTSHPHTHTHTRRSDHIMIGAQLGNSVPCVACVRSRMHRCLKYLMR